MLPESVLTCGSILRFIMFLPRLKHRSKIQKPSHAASILVFLSCKIEAVSVRRGHWFFPSHVLMFRIRVHNEHQSWSVCHTLNDFIQLEKMLLAAIDDHADKELLRSFSCPTRPSFYRKTNCLVIKFICARLEHFAILANPFNIKCKLCTCDCNVLGIIS